MTPPLKLFKQWEDDILNERDNVDHVLDCAWKDGFRAGADAELEACVEWMRSHFHGVPQWADQLRAARRPKPPSLKEQALEILQRLSKDGFPCNYQEDSDWDTIRRALEQLDD